MHLILQFRKIVVAIYAMVSGFARSADLYLIFQFRKIVLAMVSGFARSADLYLIFQFRKIVVAMVSGFARSAEREPTSTAGPLNAVRYWPR